MSGDVSMSAFIIVTDIDAMLSWQKSVTIDGAFFFHFRSLMKDANTFYPDIEPRHLMTNYSMTYPNLLYDIYLCSLHLCFVAEEFDVDNSFAFPLQL